jgi:hypothetical protein
MHVVHLSSRARCAFVMTKAQRFERGARIPEQNRKIEI